MKTFIRKICFLLVLIAPFFIDAVQVGIGTTEITPPIGTPSAGYTDRKGEGMQGVHDSLLVIALVLDNGEKKIVFCSVDNLGFPYEMVQEIIQKVHHQSGLEKAEIYIGSSHTHSGGGAYLNIPFLGEALAGQYNQAIAAFYIDKTIQAIMQANQNLQPAKVGIGYGQADNLSRYRGQWPENISPLSDVAIIKITKLDGSPLAVLFNYPMHPTILKGQNRQFSSDFVGYTRQHIQSLLGNNIQPLYFNGAQGDIIPTKEDSCFETCDAVGKSLAETIKQIWDQTSTSHDLSIETKKETYSFQPQTTPAGLILPIKEYKSEMNVIVLNYVHAFLTIPGELSSIYDRELKDVGKQLGYRHVSILGLVNDAHGYIILPGSWKRKTFESHLSFGGEEYGEVTKERAIALLKIYMPKNP